MAFKQFELEGIGPVTIYKRRGTRSIRLTVDHTGRVKISMPTWTPYATGLNFAKSKALWLNEQVSSHRPTPLVPNGAIGKQHRLEFVQQDGTAVRSRITKDGVIRIVHPYNTPWDSPNVQTVVRRAAVRALRTEAEQLLPGRLRQLATQHGLSYRSVTVKQLKSRWGSCDQDQNITLNLFLMQLPWHLIDYVLLHELTHTKVMQHGPSFWQAMGAVEPETALYRREIRDYKTILTH